MEKYCVNCKKAGHDKKECWSKRNGSERKQIRRSRQEKEIRGQVNVTIRAKENETCKEDAELSFSSSEEEEKKNRKITRAAREHQVAQITGKTRVSAPKFDNFVNKGNKKRKTEFLVGYGCYPNTY
ncbi:hypothetical protein P5V15_010303 [Pogonomyrmex californicus]